MSGRCAMVGHCRDFASQPETGRAPRATLSDEGLSVTEPPAPDEQPDVVPSDAPPPPIETPDEPEEPSEGEGNGSWQTLPLT